MKDNKITISDFSRKKRTGEKITMLTAVDAYLNAGLFNEDLDKDRICAILGGHNFNDNYIVKNVLKLEPGTKVSYVDAPEVGRYFKEQVFGPGAVYHWSEMIERSTGEELTPKYFVAMH